MNKLTDNVKQALNAQLHNAGFELETDWVQLKEGRVWTAEGFHINRNNYVIFQYIGDSDEIKDGFSSVFTFAIKDQIRLI